MWKLVIEDDEGKRTLVPLTRDQYSVGRKEGNTIRLTERNVSREHARLFKKPANGAPAPPDKPTFVLEDLTSYNGVFVNGLRITHAQDLSHGDLVQIGDYRIVLQDELVADISASSLPNDAKSTLPQGGHSRASTLMDRPNRLVMLAGPTPGAEFPLVEERMTVGRAEDASVSINHNSVSRLHCEVHALGDGRFEIVDKGSSNGVRVNSAELRRGIVEPGDVIELGDVKFKFIGAGQIFRPTESQQLAVLNDRAAGEIVRGKRGATALPLAIFAVVVIAGAIGAWVYTRPHPPTTSTAPTATAAMSPDQQAVADAQKLIASGDPEGAHEKLATVPDGAAVRSSPEFKDVENKWADQELAHADAEPDFNRKRALYQRVSQDPAVDPARRKAAADKLQSLDAVAVITTATPSALPAASGKPDPQEVALSRFDGGRRTALAPDPANPPATTAPAPLPPVTAPTTATATAPRPTGASVDDKERLLALQGTQDSKMALKQQLEQKVYSGRASDTEINLLISTCKDLGDKLCVGQARQIKLQKQQNNP
ncbi:MAG TPA: FHA domain-containing protein [Polyangiaceae bacterium]|jgi:pSer/pThr/pTyr-binding forkhead associated (FHA) protein